ncbi:hypothetical protein SR1949_54510 [Sphaerospermopsis reniformis]|uniref:Uncharacterized protein n=1 Tax=Sphaerospermopsis reniformis TaxID=531300 RepID=A0A480A994_9CYAN|nr:hypothetical protein SR1949_54510 [Sphaerospermopsis reniformis]
MTPLMPHEHNKRLIEKLIDTLVEELNLNVRGCLKSRIGSKKALSV